MTAAMWFGIWGVSALVAAAFSRSVTQMELVRTKSYRNWPLAFALLALVPSSAAGDATAFQAHCAKCHPRASALLRSLKGDTREVRAAALSKFLEAHHIDDPQARIAIVDYLVNLSPK